MKFKFLTVFFISVQIFSQSNIFIKFKSEDNILNELSLIRSNLSSLNAALLKKTEDPEIKLLSQIYGELDENLNRIVKIKIDSTLYNDFVDLIKSNPNIEYVHFSQEYSIDYIPEDSLYSEQWGLQNIKAEEAWDLFLNNSSEIILAVIDTGIDYLHSDINSSVFINEGEVGVDQNGNDKSTNGIDDDQNGFIDDYQGWDFVDKIKIFNSDLNYDFVGWDNDPSDEHGHGTNMAGIISASHNQFGIAGVNPNVKILNLRAFDKNGNGEEDDVAAAIIYAVKMGAEIINMSWGDNVYSAVLKDIIEYAYNQNVLLVSSAGNSSSNEPHFPSSFSEVISVGAIQSDDNIANFSNYGSTIDLVAPGSQIMTLDLNNSYKKVSGTSAAAPFVSAAAAAIIPLNDFENEEIKQILKTTSRDLGDSGWDELYGAGTLDFSKALSVLSPSIITINHPQQEFYTKDDSITVNITCLSPYFKNYKLYYGIGVNPDKWNYLQLPEENYQVVNEDIINFDISSFADTSYTFRLLVERIDGRTLEERVNFYIDRTPPKVLSYNLFPAFINKTETVQASIQTDDPSIVTLNYRNKGTSDEFKNINLDGFVNNISVVSTEHFGFLPEEVVVGGIEMEFFFTIKNKSGLSRIFTGETSDFISVENNFNRSFITNYKKDYSIPNGRIFKTPVKFNGFDENFVLINENNSPADLSIYQFSSNELVKKRDIPSKIPVAAGDLDKDSKTDILSLFVKNGFIDSQIETGELNFENNFSDSSETFWPSYAGDIDDDGNYELIVFSSDTSLTIWEVTPKFKLFEEAVLINSNKIDGSNTSFFRNNVILVGNFDDDSEKEIVSVDNYGRLIIYQINGHSDYTNDRIVEHFYPLEANATIAGGDFNGDQHNDIAVIMEFEENVYLTPLIYSVVVSITNDSLNYLFQNMFITTEDNFISSFDKRYNSILLEDIDNNSKDELIIFTFPNAYIFNYAQEGNEFTYYQSNVNSQSIFTGDIDGNGIIELGIPDGELIYFNEYVKDDKIPPPIFTEYYSLDSNKIYFEWVNDNKSVYIYKGTDTEELSLYDSTSENFYIDEVSSNNNYFYSLQYFDTDSLLSIRNTPIEIYAHAPGRLKSFQVVDSKNVQFTFSEKIDFNKLNLSNFNFEEDIEISSLIPASEYSINLVTNQKIENGNYSLSINDVRDIYNTGIIDTTLNFEINLPLEDERYLTISNHEVLNGNTVIISFNFNLDTLSSLNTNNYSFSPNNEVKSINFYQDQKNSVVLISKNPFGSIGMEYVLRINNIFSSRESGNLPISENSGSEIVFTSFADNLDDIYVYPNPVNLTENSKVTFANLTSFVDIYIFSLDGKLINLVTERDGNGGTDWNLLDKNNQSIGSGIYIYKAIAKDADDKKLHEKIGKFAVIK